MIMMGKSVRQIRVNVSFQPKYYSLVLYAISTARAIKNLTIHKPKDIN